MSKKQYNQICKRVTDKILDFLKEGTIPWMKPWKGGKFNAPRSVSTGKTYRGTNLTLLGCVGYDSPWWLTFGQAKKLGGQVRKGEKSMPVHYWKFHDPVDCEGSPWNSSDSCSGKDCTWCKGTGKRRPMPSLFSFNVFNANQCEGLPEKY